MPKYGKLFTEYNSLKMELLHQIQRWNVIVTAAAAALHLDVVLQGYRGLHKVLSFYEDKFVLLHLAHCSLVHPRRHNRLLEVGREQGRGWSRGT